MASVEEVASLRRMVAEPTDTTYTDEALSALIDTEESVEGAAGVVWREKAASAATLVNVSESGSSRSLSDIHKNALAMAKFYEALDVTEDEIIAAAPFTSSIERS